MKIIYKTLFTLMLLSVIANNLSAENLCYKADKNDFLHTPGTAHDIIFDLSDLKKNQSIYLSFLSLLPLPYADSTYDFYCMAEEKNPENYLCVGDDDGGRMHLLMENGYIDVNVEYARMANTTDDPVIHKIQSKQNKFTDARRTVCPKPHIFKSKQEKHLPFVCYNRKDQEVIDGKNKNIFTGCTRYNMPCKSIDAQHFGQYPNDYEAYKAYLRCGNSTPNTVPKTSSLLETHTFVKSDKKKKALIDSISIKDVAIYDLDYYKDLVIAVGEDTSEETIKAQLMEEYHKSVMLRSTDAGKSWRKIGKKAESDIPFDFVIVLDEKHILIASSFEGAGGSIIRSEDAGNTWETRYSFAMIESLKQVEGNTLIAQTLEGPLKSIDGGKNWVVIDN